MGKALGCGAAGIVGIVIWIITVLIIVFMFFIDVNRNIDRALNLAADFPDLEIVCEGLNELAKNFHQNNILKR